MYNKSGKKTLWMSYTATLIELKLKAIQIFNFSGDLNDCRFRHYRYLSDYMKEIVEGTDE